MSRLTDMRSRFDSGFSSSDRSYIEQLYRSLLNKTVRRSGCADCYRDAFLEIYTYLKRTGKMPTKPNYVLKAGVIVHPNGTNQFYANANIPDEVAEKRLAEYPESISDFLSYPSDYLARVEARKMVRCLLRQTSKPCRQRIRRLWRSVMQQQSRLLQKAGD